MTRKIKKTVTKSIYAQARKHGLRYVGSENAHMTGMPACDISGEAVSFIGENRIDEVMATGLYELNSELNSEVSDE